MTDQHPLTDDLCCQIWQDNKDNWFMWQEPCPSTRRIMRGAADWQLEQVIEWIRDTHEEYIIEDLREAMRPTQEDNG